MKEEIPSFHFLRWINRLTPPSLKIVDTTYSRPVGDRDIDIKKRKKTERMYKTSWFQFVYHFFTPITPPTCFLYVYICNRYIEYSNYPHFISFHIKLCIKLLQEYVSDFRLFPFIYLIFFPSKKPSKTAFSFYESKYLSFMNEWIWFKPPILWISHQASG